jgi:cytochrome b6-f complex iron-sulfur subunit
MAVSRRELLRNGWKVGGALLGLAAGWTMFESMRPLAGGSNKAKIKLGNPADFATDTSTYVNSGRMYVTNAGGQLFALSQKCPHLGCRVPYCDSSGRFECACHGSIFDLGGEWIEGPAPRGMDHFELTVANDVLYADTAVLIEGPPQGQKKFLTPPKGPSCIGKT